MIRICGGDDTHPRTQPMERTVELISLDNHEVGIGQDIVGTIVLRDAAQEGVAVKMTLVHDMGTHRRGGCLSVSASHTESFVRLCEDAKYLSPLLDLEAVLTEETEFPMTLRDSRGIDDETTLTSFTGKGYLVYILLIMNQHTFLLQMARQVGGGLIVARHDESLLQEITGDGTHANATSTNEVDRFNIFNHIYNFANLMTSLAMISAESGNASFFTFSLRVFSRFSSATVLMANSSRTSGASASFT